MRSVIIFFIFLVAGCTFVHGQTHTTPDSIGVKKHGMNYFFSRSGKPITVKQLTPLVRTNPEAAKLFQKAQNLRTLGVCLGGAGGGLIGYQLGASLGGGKANWVAAGIGVGLIAACIPIAKASDKKLLRSVDAYNASIRRTARRYVKPQYYIAFTGNMLGVTVKF